MPVGSLDVTMYRDDLRSQPTRAVEPTHIPGHGVDWRVFLLVDDRLYSGRAVPAAVSALYERHRPGAGRVSSREDEGQRGPAAREAYVGK